MATHYDRRTEDTVVISADPHDFMVDAGWSFSNRGLGLEVGTRIRVETIRGSQVVGIMNLDTGTWYYRKTDEEIDIERQELLERIAAEQRADLDANRDDWQRRTDALPDWIKKRITYFQQSGGSTFELEGWGYELCVAELAVLYFDNMLDDDAPAIKEYARREGTTGNQHAMARALAATHLEGHSLSGTVSALSPLTGDADYSGTK